MSSNRIRVHHVDVFTDVAGDGNPAGVVLAADGLSTAAMQTIAADVGASETAFVLAPRAAAHDVWVRFFTPEREVPVCGHATLAAQAVRGLARGLETGEVVQGSAGATWRVSWRREAGVLRASMVQEPVVFGDVVEGALARYVYAALGGERPIIAPPPRIVSTGHAKVVVPVASVEALRAMRPDLAALRALSTQVGAEGWFVFALTDDDDALTECRMFAPSIGIAEDPVNGSGHGPLAAYLAATGLIDSARNGMSFVSRMGHAFGRTGHVHVRLETDAGRPVRAHVGGGVVPTSTADLEISKQEALRES